MKYQYSLKQVRTNKNIRTSNSIRTNTGSGQAAWTRLKETEQLQSKEKNFTCNSKKKWR
jgi:hypothetical protein